MPNRDKTGPQGQGPLTGRQMGNCKGANPLVIGRGPCGRGLRQGFGRGFGFRQNFTPQEIVLTKEQEKKILEQELKNLETEKQEIAKRIKDFK